MLLQNNSILPM